MQRTNTETLKLKLLGLTRFNLEANIAPATPAKAAPEEKASSLVLTVSIPIAAAAISSSRIAIHARPNRELRRLVTAKMRMTTMTMKR